jgi:hypothetical protein
VRFFQHTLKIAATIHPRTSFGHLVDLIVVSHMILHLYSDRVLSFGSLDILMLNLHRFHHLSEVGGMFLDMDGVSYRECSFSNVNSGYPNFAEIAWNFSDFLLWKWMV